MAQATGTSVKCNYNEIKELTLVAPTAVADGVKFSVPTDARMESIVIVAQNGGSSAGTVTVKAPTDGGYAATDTDLSVSVTAGGIAVIRVESARYFNKDNSIVVTGATTSVKVGLAY